MATGGSADHSLWHDPGSSCPLDLNMTTGGSWAFLWFLVAMQAMDINTDPDCGRITDPDTALSIVPVLGGSPGHSVWYCPSFTVALAQEHGSR